MLPVDGRGIVSIGKVDPYTGQILTHDDKGERIEGFQYKGVEYKDQDIFQGFDAIAKDIRDFDEKTQSAFDIREALTLVNSIYADETTIIKPKMIAKSLIEAGRLAAGSEESAAGKSTEELLALGLGSVLDRLKIPIVICGHNTIDKLEANGMGVLNRDDKQVVRFISIDGGMSPKFKGRGMIARISAKDGFGLRIDGFAGKDTDIQILQQVPGSELFTS